MVKPPPQGKPRIAKQGLQQTLEVTSLLRQGLGFHQKGQLDQARAIYAQVLAKHPNNFDAMHLLGVLFMQAGHPAQAEQLIAKALTLNPHAAFAHNNRGNAFKDLQRLQDALTCYDQAIAIDPHYVEALNNRGNALKALQRLQEALASYDQVITLKPGFADALNNRGTVLHALHRLDEALVSYDQAIALQPEYAEALYNRGNALQDLQRLPEALASYDQAIALRPQYAEAHYNRGNALKDLQRLSEALASYDQAIALRADYAEAFNNRGSVLKDLARLDEALRSYEQAIAVNPNDAQPFNNRGNILRDLKRLPEALASYERAMAIQPDYDYLPGTKLHTQMHACDWRQWTGQLQALSTSIAAEHKAAPPFAVLGLIDDPALQRIAATVYAQDLHPASETPDCFNKVSGTHPIRIGYYSADFHNHATSYLMAELFESHDASQFEIYGFSFGPQQQDSMRARVSGSFKAFHDVRHLPDRAVAQLSRDLAIDIAVDLKGYTEDCRTGIFAERCAPIQVNYLGYPGTMGVPYMDYIIADQTLIPETSQGFYSEKVVYMPHSYQVNDSQRQISEQEFTRQDAGLPENGFVFCCFNNNYKILPSTFDGWMRILQAVPGSVLWLFEGHPTAIGHLRQEAQSRGIDPARLVFAQRLPLSEHLARHRLADLFIDTLPCNAHTTASDALWAGLPVLTLAGQSFAARVAASLLQALDLPELVMPTQSAYEARAIELATHPELLVAIRHKLQINRLSSTLFNGQAFARHLEAAYRVMLERHRHGLAPDHIHIAP